MLHYTVGWGRTQADPAFGNARDETSIKAKSIHLIASVRTVMRGRYCPYPFPPAFTA